jgi:hypothetical protein
MEKCRDCNSILKKEETVCYACGSSVHRKDEALQFSDYLTKTVSFMLYFSGVLTVASLFLSFTPPFAKCGIATLILGIVKSSANQMVERKKS